jgi:hypothetical protein
MTSMQKFAIDLSPNVRSRSRAPGTAGIFWRGIRLCGCPILDAEIGVTTSNSICYFYLASLVLMKHGKSDEPSN